MSDGIVVEGIKGLGAYGPIWIILLFIIVAAVIIAIAMVPTVKEWVEAKSEREKASQQIAKEREDRKREEMVQRAEKDGQMIALVAENNKVIERNSSAFRQVTKSIEQLNEKTSQLDSTMQSVVQSKQRLEEHVAEMRIDIAGLKGEK